MNRSKLEMIRQWANGGVEVSEILVNDFYRDRDEFDRALERVVTAGERLLKEAARRDEAEIVGHLLKRAETFSPESLRIARKGAKVCAQTSP